VSRLIYKNLHNSFIYNILLISQSVLYHNNQNLFKSFLGLQNILIRNNKFFISKVVISDISFLLICFHASHPSICLTMPSNHLQTYYKISFLPCMLYLILKRHYLFYNFIIAMIVMSLLLAFIIAS